MARRIKAASFIGSAMLVVMMPFATIGQTNEPSHDWQRISDPPVQIADAQPRCVPEILCNPPKLNPRYRSAYTGMSGEVFEKLPNEGKWGYISGVWDRFIYRYYFEKDEEYKWLAACFRKYQGTGKINPVDATPEISLGIRFSSDKTRPASEFILAQIRATCVLGVSD